jgi:hypothetical protein
MADRKVTDEELIAQLLSGKTQSEISRHFGMRACSVSERFARLLSKPGGEGLARYLRASIPPKVPDETVLSEALLGYGAQAIANRHDAAYTGVNKTLTRLRKLHPDLDALVRARYPHKKPGTVRNRRRATEQEFTTATKKEAYALAQGACCMCHQPIPSWRLSTYHHKTAIIRGGTGETSNCMVMHRKCHEDNFHALHGFFPPTRYINAGNPLNRVN